MKESTKNRFVRVIGCICLGLLFNIAFPGEMAKSSWNGFFLAFLYDAFVAYILWEANYQIYKFWDNRLSWNQIAKRIIFQSATSLSYTLFIVFVFIPLSNLYLFNQKIPNWNELIPTLIAIIFITVMITSINAGKEFLEEWRKSVKEQEALRRKYAEAQYRSLRSQVNPHFLFNSFNTLNALILESPEKARSFTDQLAEFYRKVLHHSNAEISELSEEINLLKNYSYLIKTRYEDDVQIMISIEENFDNAYLPHMSLQLCLENAIKHNKVSSRHPLKVEVTQKGKMILVKNKIDAKNVLAKESSGLGLKQIEAVYSSNKVDGFAYGEKNGYFEVELPLILNYD